MKTLLECQQQAHREDPMPSLRARRDRLERLLSLLNRYESQIVDAVMSDFGYRSPEQSFFVEIMTSAKPIKEAVKNLKHWMKTEKRHVDVPFWLMGGRASVHYQPLGVVGCISPWNFPFNLTFAPLASIIAAGNRAMVKPSEATPASAELMSEMFRAVFDETEVACITGGVDVAEEFSALPFDHLIYTGGEQVAKKIMSAASENLTPLTLELGGKSPVVIGDGANLPLAAKRIMFGKVLNAGQICLAPDYVLVPNNKLAELLDALKYAVEEMVPESCGTRDYVSIVNKGHALRLERYVEDARENGAEIIDFDWLSRSDEHDKNFVAPTLVVNPPENSLVLTHEIFGPLLVVKTYSVFSEVIDHINARPKPLALYYFGRSKQQQTQLLEKTSSGGVTINDVIMHYTMDDLPFGGVGPSGMGSYHGVAGFKQFSHARSVYKQSSFDIAGKLRPPYGSTFKKLTRFLLRFG